MLWVWKGQISNVPNVRYGGQEVYNLEEVMYSKSAPSVTDPNFGIRVPTFMVVHGHVLHWMAVDKNSERIMKAGDSVRYNRHGEFKVCCIHGGHAIIVHTTRYGKIMNLVVPERQWLDVSNGSYRTTNPHYESFESAYEHLAAKPETDLKNDLGQPWVHHPPELTEKYHVLLNAFDGYWKENFDKTCQEDEDSVTFTLGARIRYGMACAMNGQAIPSDCDYEKLVKEVDAWIDYLEKSDYGMDEDA
jgi:hypothetical protein